jgi:DTW domain-containing protein YfiP
MPRQVCGRCTRPTSVCYCQWLPARPLDTHGGVLILQHPHEQSKKLRTVPILNQCLERCWVSPLV